MSNPESIDERLARIGSKAAMEERVEARLRGEINAPVPGPRGMSACVKQMHRNGFRPSAPVQRMLRPVTTQESAKPLPSPEPPAKPKRGKKSGTFANCQPMTPKHGHTAKSGYAAPQKKWDDRCSTCAGVGEIIGILGDRQACPRCAE